MPTITQHFESQGNAPLLPYLEKTSSISKPICWQVVVFLVLKRKATVRGFGDSLDVMKWNNIRVIA
ncbi:MAG: hypothetical protein U1D30_06945 [Planctomycetota bacterium]